MGDGVHDLDVALQRNDHQTDLASRHTDTGQGSGVEENTDEHVDEPVSASVVDTAVSDVEKDGNCNEAASEEIKDGLVNDEGVDVAAELSTCAYQNGQHERVGDNADDTGSEADSISDVVD